MWHKTEFLYLSFCAEVIYFVWKQATTTTKTQSFITDFYVYVEYFLNFLPAFFFGRSALFPSLILFLLFTMIFIITTILFVFKWNGVCLLLLSELFLLLLCIFWSAFLVFVLFGTAMRNELILGKCKGNDLLSHFIALWSNYPLISV